MDLDFIAMAMDMLASLFDDSAVLLRETCKRFGSSYRALLSESLGKFHTLCLFLRVFLFVTCI